MMINEKEITWDDVSREQLRHLLVHENMGETAIARAFSVSVSKVRYKRTKYRLTRADVLYERFSIDEKETFGLITDDAKQWFLDSQNIDMLSKIIVNYAFRSGPVETIHSNGKSLTDADMKEINISMVNRIAGLLTQVLDEDWLRLKLLLSYYDKGLSEWQPAEPDMSIVNEVVLQCFTKPRKIRNVATQS